MRSGKWIAVPALLLLGLSSGCLHKRHHPAPPPPPAPGPSLPTPAQTTAMIPPLPLLPEYLPSTVLLNTAVPPETPESTASRHRIFHRHAHPETAARQPEPAQAAPQPAPTAQDATGPPSASSPIGQLSTAGGDAGAADRDTIAKLIDSTQRQLNAMKHPLNSQEQKIAAQIRTFLDHARESLKTNDLDGAQTLAVKAQLLLQELQKP